MNTNLNRTSHESPFCFIFVVGGFGFRQEVETVRKSFRQQWYQWFFPLKNSRLIRVPDALNGVDSVERTSAQALDLASNVLAGLKSSRFAFVFRRA